MSVGKISKYKGPKIAKSPGFLSAGRGNYRRTDPVEIMAVEGRAVRDNRNTTVLVAQRSPGGQVTAEDGYFDTERTSTLVPNVGGSWTGTEMDPNTSAMLCLFAPVQGDDISNRRARKVFVKKIRISGVLVIAAATALAAPQTPVQVRIVVFMDKQTNGAQVSPSVLLASGAGSDALHMFQSTAGFGRFKVFKDKTFTLQPSGTFGPSTGSLIGQTGVQREFSFTIKPNVWVNYNATNGGTVADIIDNSFHLCVNCNNGTATNQPNILYKVRTVFTP